MLALLVGLVAVALACRLAGLDGAVRSAGVALVIVLLRDEHETLGSSETRVLLVMLGCVIALAVTLCGAYIERVWMRAGDSS
jgi:hypothetical protein